jgi:hypothetical protein
LGTLEALEKDNVVVGEEEMVKMNGKPAVGTERQAWTRKGRSQASVAVTGGSWKIERWRCDSIFREDSGARRSPARSERLTRGGVGASW